MDMNGRHAQNQIEAETNMKHRKCINLLQFGIFAVRLNFIMAREQLFSYFSITIFLVYFKCKNFIFVNEFN